MNDTVTNKDREKRRREIDRERESDRNKQMKEIDS
jgi:hypothetical protein